MLQSSEGMVDHLDKLNNTKCCFSSLCIHCMVGGSLRFAVSIQYAEEHVLIECHHLILSKEDPVA